MGESASSETLQRGPLDDERALRLVLEAARIAVWTWDTAADRLLWSRSLVDLLGNEPRGSADFLALVHPDDREVAACLTAELVAGLRDDFSSVLRIVRPDGGVRWVENRGRAVRRADGGVERIDGTMLDITDRRHAEEARRASEKRFQAIIEHAPNVAIQLYDRDARVVLWNRASERIFGWPSSDALGRTLDALMLSAADAHTFADAIHALDRGGEPRGPLEFPFRNRDGPTGTCLKSIFALPGDGPLFVCMAVDITPRKHAEERLLQAAKVETIGRLAGGVAHDFNNLLTAILGYGELLERALPRGGVPAQHLAALLEAAGKGAQLTAQLLAFARKQVVQPRVVDANERVRRALALLTRLIGEHIDLKADLCSAPLRVRIDPAQFEQVLINLAVNARDAMPRGGRIAVVTSPRDVQRGEFGALAPGAYAAIEVSDSGEGIPADVMPRIFEPFFTTKADGRGTGLGLATCHGIVEQHGGAIAVRSAAGRGTTFTVMLPLVDEPTDDPAPARREAPAPGRETILLVEDERAIRDLAAGYLRSLGYRVLAAEDGHAALALVEDEPRIDALVTDVVMPRIGGVELSRMLTRERIGLRTVFTSGYNDQPPEATTGPGTAFLAKPYQMRELADRLRTLLDA